MRRRLRTISERMRGSLFHVPAIVVVVSIALAQTLRWADERFASELAEVPGLLSPSAESARVILTTIAAATITVAGIVFSITLVALQLVASHFSPRILRGFLRDRFSQLVIGLVVGTFTYSLVVLTGARRPPDDVGQLYVARLSTTVAVTLAVLSVFAIIAFIDRTARSMQVGHVIQRIADETHDRIAQLFPHAVGELPPQALAESPLPAGDASTIRASRHGWVQAIDIEALTTALQPADAVRIDVRVGTFVVERTPLCTVWPAHRASAPLRTTDAQRAFAIGRERTMWEDVAFGVLQLEDIALRALSPGVNDPTTANDAISAIGGILADLLHRDLPPRVREVAGRRVYRPHDLGPTAYVDLSFDQLRVASARQPAVCIMLLRTLSRLREKLEHSGLDHRVEALRRQARLVVRGAQEGCLLVEDRQQVANAAAELGLVEGS